MKIMFPIGMLLSVLGLATSIAFSVLLLLSL